MITNSIWHFITRSAQPFCGLLLIFSTVAVSHAGPTLCRQLSSTSQNEPEVLPPNLKIALLSYVQSLLRVDAPTALDDKTITANELKDLSELSTTESEKQFLEYLGQKANAGELPLLVKSFVGQAISLLENQAQYQEKVKGLTPEKRAMAEQILIMALQSTLSERGLLKNVKSNYVEWAEIDQNVSTQVLKVQNLNFDEKLKALTGEHFYGARQMRLLADGPRALENRLRYIRQAQSEITLFYWALYDDMTGHLITNELLAAAGRGIKIRVLVDGQTSQRPGYGDEVSRLEKSGRVEVIRWFHTDFPHLGQHIKSMIVDGRFWQTGGMNGGDVYSHLNPKAAHWRDTDFAFEGGEIILRAQNEMARIWNQQIKLRSLNLTPMRTYGLSQKEPSGSSAMVIRHDPSRDRKGSAILKALVASIDSARESVDIENAYVIATPSLKSAISRAVQRGVKVRIFTNSHKSVDEPIIAIPILRSAQDLSALKAQVYLRTGSTLHSKVAIIDSEYSFIMSYNIHPRSEKLENELLVVIKGKKMGETMTEMYQEDIKTAITVEKPSDITIPFDPSVLFTLRILFDQL